MRHQNRSAMAKPTGSVATSASVLLRWLPPDTTKGMAANNKVLPMPMMTLNRLAIALRVVVKDTGKVGEESLLEHCRSRAAKDAIGEQAE